MDTRCLRRLINTALTAASLALLFTLAGCERDSCKEYSRFTCNQLEAQTFNVYYYDDVKPSAEPNELFLGAAIGLQQCGALAWDAARARKKDRANDWSYVCCLKTDDSSCAEKHR